MTRFLASASEQDPSGVPRPSLSAGSGTHAGLAYRIEGRGLPLILLPFFLAPSQWEPALAELLRHFTVIQVGGPHIGGVAALEDRARAPTYQAMFRTLVDLMAPEAGGRILDVGCGSGALDRLLAARLGTTARIDAVDINPFLLREAADLAVDFGERIQFPRGSALALPFADQTFDCIFSVTMLQECNADGVIAEMMRVARPGARIGLVVRAIDIPQRWNLALPAEIRAKAEIPPQSVGPGGVADASLYARMRRAGLVNLRAFPALITLDEPTGPIWRYREDHVLSQFQGPRPRRGRRRPGKGCSCKPTRSIVLLQRSKSVFRTLVGSPKTSSAADAYARCLVYRAVASADTGVTGPANTGFSILSSMPRVLLRGHACRADVEDDRAHHHGKRWRMIKCRNQDAK